MPTNPAVLTVTGVSSSAASYALGYPYWIPDYGIRPFNIGIGVEFTSTGSQVYNVEHTFDYQGQLSSDWNGFISSAATWFANTGLTGATSQANGNYAFPVSMIRLNVVSGTSQAVTRCILMQA